uniref:Uncharacterized protein n=1 Tax=Anopheles arabiensis TaxID=7173 RepID=A0A8W7MTE0_ANOAR
MFIIFHYHYSIKFMCLQIIKSFTESRCSAVLVGPCAGKFQSLSPPATGIRDLSVTACPVRWPRLAVPACQRPAYVRHPDTVVTVLVQRTHHNLHQLERNVRPDGAVHTHADADNVTDDAVPDADRSGHRLSTVPTADQLLGTVPEQEQLR